MFESLEFFLLPVIGFQNYRVFLPPWGQGLKIQKKKMYRDDSQVVKKHFLNKDKMILVWYQYKITFLLILHLLKRSDEYSDNNISHPVSFHRTDAVSERQLKEYQIPIKVVYL